MTQAHAVATLLSADGAARRAQRPIWPERSCVEAPGRMPTSRALRHAQGHRAGAGVDLQGTAVTSWARSCTWRSTERGHCELSLSSEKTSPSGSSGPYLSVGKRRRHRTATSVVTFGDRSRRRRSTRTAFDRCRPVRELQGDVRRGHAHASIVTAWSLAAAARTCPGRGAVQQRRLGAPLTVAREPQLRIGEQRATGGESSDTARRTSTTRRRKRQPSNRSRPAR